MENAVAEMNQITVMIKTIHTLRGLMGKTEQDGEVRQLLEDAVQCVNLTLYHAQLLFFQKESRGGDLADLSGLSEETDKLLGIWEKSLRNRYGVNGCEARFQSIYERYAYVDEEDILRYAILVFQDLPEDRRSEIVFGLTNLVFLEGTIDEGTGDYSLIADYVHMMKERVEDFRWLYETLADKRSKMTLLKIVDYWTGFDLDDLIRSSEGIFPDYYDLDIVRMEEDEVFVDCGAFTGDSIQKFVETYGDTYKRIYAYEMVGQVYEVLLENTSLYHDVVCRKAGVAETHKTMFLNHEDMVDGGSLAESGEHEVEVVSIDEDITEPITTIKMDIEGAEMEALLGARNHIVKDHPKLLISVYHRPADIFDIPKRIHEYSEDYELYLRFNGKVAWPADVILIAR